MRLSTSPPSTDPAPSEGPRQSPGIHRSTSLRGAREMRGGGRWRLDTPTPPPGVRLTQAAARTQLTARCPTRSGCWAHRTWRPAAGVCQGEARRDGSSHLLRPPPPQSTRVHVCITHTLAQVGRWLTAGGGSAARPAPPAGSEEVAAPSPGTRAPSWRSGLAPTSLRRRTLRSESRLHFRRATPRAHRPCRPRPADGGGGRRELQGHARRGSAHARTRVGTRMVRMRTGLSTRLHGQLFSADVVTNWF